MGKKINWTLTRFQKTALSVWAGAGVLLIAGFFAVYLPQHRALGQINQKYIESGKQAQLAQKAAAEDTRKQLEICTRQTAEQLGAFTIPSDQISSLVFDIGRMAGELNLAGFASKSIDAQQPLSDKKKAKPLLSEAWLSVEFQGSYQQFANFVNRLERSSPVVFVEKVFVTRQRQETEGCQFTMELSILTTTGTNAPALAMTNSENKPK